MGANAQTAVPVFTAGQVLTAVQQTQINTGIPVFATTVTRDAAFGGAGEKVLAEGQFAYIEATNTTQYYDGANWQSVAPTSTKIGQVVSTTKTDTFTTASTSYVDVTGLTVSITPTAATSKILVLFDGVAGGNTGAAAVHARLMRDSTAIDIGDAAANRTQVTTGGISDQSEIFSISANFLDSPATTTATVYKVQVRTNGTTIAINRSVDDSNLSQRARGASTITVMEVIV